MEPYQQHIGAALAETIPLAGPGHISEYGITESLASLVAMGFA